MSNCRCGDIKVCKKNLARLNQALDELTKCEGNLTSISGKLSDVASKCNETYDGENKPQLVNKIENLDIKLYPTLTSCQERIRGKIKELQKDLVTMEKEDEEYHDDDEDTTSNTTQSST